MVVNTTHAIHLQVLKERKEKILIFLPSIEWMAERWHEAKDSNGEGRKNKWPNNSGFRFTVNLHAFLKDSEFKPDWPFNIIVLAFYMSEIHGKIWSEKEGWVKG